MLMRQKARARVHKNRTYGNPVEEIFRFFRQTLKWNMKRKSGRQISKPSKQKQERH